MTYQCNLNCVFCYNPLRDKTISINAIDSLVKRIAEFKIPQIYLIGGEPSILGVDKLNEYIEILSQTSSVTIVTNGYIKLKGISNKLANMAVSLHGYDQESHEIFNGVKGSYNRAVESIKYYKSLGLNVRCVVVLSGHNYNTIGKILLNCINAGVDEIYIDRYEDGGIGASNSANMKLKPTNNQFREALSQIIEVRNLNLIPKNNIAFGTAIPFCVDTRLFSEGLLSTCTAGTGFCAVNPNGEVRLCNQSEVIYGNIFDEDIDIIWSPERTCNYRSLDWVEEPCKSCRMLDACQSGCRVDANCKKPFTIDYALRDEDDPIIKENIELINKEKLVRKMLYESFEPEVNIKTNFFKANRFLRVNEYKDNFYVVAQFQGSRIGEAEFDILKYILTKSAFNLCELINKFKEYQEDSIQQLLHILLFIGAIEKVESEEVV